MSEFFSSIYEQQDYYFNLLIVCGIYCILAQSFNLTFGLGRLLNLAHVATYAIGAYATAILATFHGQPIHVCIVVSMLFSAALASLIGLISLKLADDYFAIGSLAFNAVVIALLINLKDLTKGVLGIPGIPRPEIFGFEFKSNASFFALLFAIDILVMIVLYILFQSSFGRNVRAQAESEQFSLSLGKDTHAIKVMSFIISSSCAGLAGSMFSYYYNYIDPSSFGLHEMIFVFSIVIVGKPGSFWGVLLGTIFLVLLPEPLRFLEIDSSILGPMRQLLYAVILFAVVYWKRDILFPVKRRV